MLNNQILSKMKKTVQKTGTDGKRKFSIFNRHSRECGNQFSILPVILAIAAMSISCCTKDGGSGVDDDGNGTEVSGTATFKIKQATIVYEMLSGLTRETATFDDNGKRFRLEDDYHIYILDENAKKAYSLEKSTKKYGEETVAFGQGKRSTYVMNVNDANFAAAGYTKSTQTVAGKSCSVYSGTVGSTTAAYGGWNDIVFLVTLNGGDVIRAVSFSETVAANSFTVPSDYTKK